MAYARPNSDVSVTGWVPVGAATAYETIDEASADDADYVSGTVDSPGMRVLGIDQILPAGSHTMNFRLATNTGTASVRVHAVDGSNASLGATVWQDITATPTDYSLTVISTGQFSRIGFEYAPDNIITDETGDPILTEDGQYITEE